jgi:hypothetical protein
LQIAFRGFIVTAVLLSWKTQWEWILATENNNDSFSAMVGDSRAEEVAVVSNILVVNPVDLVLYHAA